jgi:hypothetical protein
VERSLLIARLLQGRSNLALPEVLEWGCAALDEVYGGDPDAWRTEGSVPLRRLAAAAELSTSTLYRYVAVASLWRTCGEPPIEHLGISHLRELLPLYPRTQRELMLQAEREKWTVSRIKRQASFQQRRPEVLNRGRPPRSPGYLHALRHVHAWNQTEGRLHGLENAEEMCDGEAKELLKMLRTMRMELEMVEMRVRGDGRD